MKKCIQCGASMDDDALFCTSCGAKFDSGKHCIHCGALIDADSLFCTSCGGRQDMQSQQPIQNSPQTDSYIQEEYMTEDSDNKTNLYIIVGCAVASVFILAGGWFAYQHYFNEPEQDMYTPDSVEVVQPDVFEDEGPTQYSNQSYDEDTNEDGSIYADTIAVDPNATYVVITGTNLRLRLEPSLEAGTLQGPDGKNLHPDKGDRLLYLDEEGDFYKVNFNGHEVYVSKQFSHIE